MLAGARKWWQPVDPAAFCPPAIRGRERIAIIAGSLAALHHRQRVKPALQPEGPEFAAGAAAFPRAVELLAQLPRPATGVECGFAVEAMAEAAEVIAAAVVGDEGGRVGTVDRVVDFAEQQHARQPLRQRQQG